MRSARFGFMEKKEEPRASQAPSHVAPVDPFFAHSVFNEFSPAEKQLVEEKLVDRARRSGAV